MSAEVPPTDDRAERFAAAATPEERALLLGLDLPILKRRARRIYISAIAIAVLSVALPFTALMVRNQFSLAPAQLLALVAGFAILLLPYAVADLAQRRLRATFGSPRAEVVSSVMVSVLGNLLLLAVVVLISSDPSSLFALAIVGAGTGVLHTLYPMSMVWHIVRGDARALVVIDELRALPPAMTGLAGSAATVLIIAAMDSVLNVALVYLFDAAIWAAPIVIVVCALASGLWAYLVRTSRLGAGLMVLAVWTVLTATAAILAN